MSHSIREMKEAAIPFEGAAVQKTLVDSPRGRTFLSRNWIRATHPPMSPVPCLEGRDRECVLVFRGLVLFSARLRGFYLRRRGTDTTCGRIGDTVDNGSGLYCYLRRYLQRSSGRLLCV